MFDIHTHGISEYDTATDDPEAILEIARLNGSLGVRAMLPTLYPLPVKEMRRNMATVKEAMRRQSEDVEGPRAARILGVHLEGPYLNPSMAGALDPACFRSPGIADCREVISGFEDIIRLVTVAPELPGCCEMIRALVDRGITISMGHSDASYAKARAGFQAGARGITHIFNAMRGIHHREPGIAGFALMNPDVYVEVIPDAYHLSEEILKFIFRVKSPDRIIIISDMVKGSPKAGAAHDPAGRLLGGSIGLPEATLGLEKLGIDRDMIHIATSRNPYHYLGLDPPPQE